MCSRGRIKTLVCEKILVPFAENNECRNSEEVHQYINTNQCTNSPCPL